MRKKEDEKEDEDKRAKQDVCLPPFTRSITRGFSFLFCPFSPCKPRNMHPPITISLHSLVHTSLHSSLQWFHLYTYTGDLNLIPREASPYSILRTAVDVSATHYQMTRHSHTAFDTAFVQGGVPRVVTCVHLILSAAQAVQRHFL